MSFLQKSAIFISNCRVSLKLLSKVGDISFQEYVSKGISHPVFYGDLVYKLRRVKDTPNFISSGSKIVKRLRRRQYDPLIIERTIGLVLGTSTTLYGRFLDHCIRRVKDTPNFISSGSKIVKRLRRRQYDPLIIERTIGLVLGTSTTLYGPFLDHCTLTNKAVGFYITGLVQTCSEATRSWSSSPLIVSRLLQP